MARVVPKGLRLFPGLALIIVAVGASVVGYSSWRLRQQELDRPADRPTAL